MPQINLQQSFGITTIDTAYLGGQIASMYLMREGEEIAFIDTGLQKTIPHLEKTLKQMGLNFENVTYVIPTHIHLDHAAGAGPLMEVCPNAKLIIHPRGARHIIDPTRLIESTISVYGKQKFDELYGRIIPVSENRVAVANDKDIFFLGDRKLQFIDTPGHAKHHFCIWDEKSKSMFSGDTFGLSYREFDLDDEIYILPTTTPTQFDPEMLLNSIDVIFSHQPKHICLTHFGIIEPKEKVVNQLKEAVNHYIKVGKMNGKKAEAKEIIERELMSYSLQKLKEMGTSKDEVFCENKLLNDIVLNTQGLIFWQTTSPKESSKNHS